MRSVPDTSGLGIFTRDEAIHRGWSDPALRNQIRRHGLRRLRPGVFAAPTEPLQDRFADARRRHARAAVAAARANRVAAISAAAVAALHNLPVWQLPERPCLTVPPGYVGDVERVHLHRAQLPDHHLETVRGVRATTIARSAVDIGREQGLVAAVVMGDAAMRRGVLDLDAMRRTVRDCRGWPGVRAARESVDLIDPRSESALESASRTVLRGEVPPPALQVPVFDEDGVFIGRPDFLWEEYGVVGEADGMLKYDDLPQLSLRQEKLRQERLERVGLIVVRWILADLSDLDDLVRRLREAFARGCRSEQRALWRWRTPHRPA